MVKTIGIVGGGVVGYATARAFMEWAEVRVYDMDSKKSTHGVYQTISSDLVFVCLPTPTRGDGRGCDTSALDDFFGSFSMSPGNGNFVIRSTVPVGYTRKAAEKYGLNNLIHSPEFLTARCSVTDAHLPSRNIVGAVSPGSECPHLLRELYRTRFPGVPCLYMSSDGSEAVKLFLNGFFAVKVAYFNEINQLAAKLGLDWDEVREGMLSDGRIAHSHTTVPGPDGKYGFGGACLPKDLNNLLACLNDAGVPSFVSWAADMRNGMDRRRT